jgi:hemoglobin
MNASATAAQTPFDLLGGSAVITSIVERFYDLMDAEPEYAELRAMHAADLGPMRQSLAGFLAGWAGGPRDWFDQNPGKCMMSAHAGLGVRQETARQWVGCMTRAIADCDLADHAVAKLMLERFAMMSRGMAGSS